MRNFIIILLVAICATIGAAYGLGWFTVSTQREDGSVTTSVRIDTDKIKQTTESVEEKARQFSASAKEKVADVTGTATAKGTISKIGTGEQHFTLATVDGKEVGVALTPASQITGPRGRELQVGDRVTVVYKPENGVNTAQSVHVEPGI